MSCHGYVSLDAYCHFLYSIFIVVGSVFRGRGEFCMALPLETPWKNQRQIQRKDLFLRLLCFWDKNSTKAGQIESYKFSLLFFDQVTFRSNFVLIKCCFDQISFRSIVVLIKFRFDQVSFDSDGLQFFTEYLTLAYSKFCQKTNKHVRISSFNGNTYKKLKLQKIIGLTMQKRFLYKLLNTFYTPLVYFGNHSTKLTKGSSKTSTKN